jgi:hypothetical protein
MFHYDVPTTNVHLRLPTIPVQMHGHAASLMRPNTVSLRKRVISRLVCQTPGAAAGQADTVRQSRTLPSTDRWRETNTGPTARQSAGSPAKTDPQTATVRQPMFDQSTRPTLLKRQHPTSRCHGNSAALARGVHRYCTAARKALLNGIHKHTVSTATQPNSSQAGFSALRAPVQGPLAAIQIR